MAIDFTDITKNLPSGNNMGGIGQIVYYALHRDVRNGPYDPKQEQTLPSNKWENSPAISK